MSPHRKRRPTTDGPCTFGDGVGLKPAAELVNAVLEDAERRREVRIRREAAEECARMCEDRAEKLRIGLDDIRDVPELVYAVTELKLLARRIRKRFGIEEE